MDTDRIKILKYALISAVIGAAIYFGLRPYVLRSSAKDWDNTTATYPTHGAPQAYIHGWATTPFEEARFALLWKTDNDKWLVYELDPHGNMWDKYKIQLGGDNLMVMLNNKVVDVFDPKMGTLNHLREKHTDTSPVAIIHGANLEHEQQWVHYSDGK